MTRRRRIAAGLGAVMALTVTGGLMAAGPASAAQDSPAGAGVQRMQQGNPGMERMHELMAEGNPGMERMHELMAEGNPGMERMHELMMR